MRLDQYLVEKGYFESRNKAKVAIEEGSISVNGIVVKKSSKDILDTDLVKITGEVCPFVSRGGYKLLHAIESFYLDFKDKVIVDIGASTGGFTDCSLQHGAKKVYSIDVGSDQLDLKLRNNPNVISLENTNIKDIPYFPENIDYFVMDVSFVSIEYLIPDIERFITKDNALVCLIKPQFEVGKMYLKNGIVKDLNLHVHVIDNLMKELDKYHLGITKLVPSPILGGSGNKEYLALIQRDKKANINVLEVVKGK